MAKPVDLKKVDTKEFDFPETLYVRDIDNQVFQGIVLQCLAKIPGISLVEGNFIENFLGRSTSDAVKGITAEQDLKTMTVNIKIELNVLYGLSIPELAEKIQTLVSEEITRLTGLHVSTVHIIFKNVIPPTQEAKVNLPVEPAAYKTLEEDYNDEF